MVKLGLDLLVAMDPFMRLGALIMKIFGILSVPFLILFNKYKDPISVPPCTNPLLHITVVDLARKIREQEISSEEIVRAYIERVKEVNPLINAVVQDRFEEAIEEAKQADYRVGTTSLTAMENDYPILGVPFTVKESCKLSGMTFSVGHIPRKGMTALGDGETVAKIRSAGGIPLLVSNTPEFCSSWECSNLITGRSVNPYDRRRTCGGSSGGEGALIGCGASLFGVGTDMAGSIRVPAQFNGIFGHKPTPRVVSMTGHYPYIEGEQFLDLAVMGPLCRYASDLPLLLEIMGGTNAPQLRLRYSINLQYVKIYYKKSAGLSIVDVPVQSAIKNSMEMALEHFRKNGNEVEEFPFDSFQHFTEMSTSKLFTVEMPMITKYHDYPPKYRSSVLELVKSAFGQSIYSFAGLFFVNFYKFTNTFLFFSKARYVKQLEEVRGKFLESLGENSVLLYPTYPQVALRHYDSFSKMMAVSYPLAVNVLGFPATHVPLGKDRNGLPVGFSVIAAPYQDRLCLSVAAEIEKAFGVWKFP